mmetsp:Transcript_91172/g.294672  ORF Transcript_91172/g.294672 Transcript_91172/m.294672 type:complete len:220 (-) Transcript_91172:3831-4490(-)
MLEPPQQGRLSQERCGNTVIFPSVCERQVDHAEQDHLAGAKTLAFEGPALGASLGNLFRYQELIHEPGLGPVHRPHFLAMRHLTPQLASRRSGADETLDIQATEDLEERAAALAVVQAGPAAEAGGLLAVRGGRDDRLALGAPRLHRVGDQQFLGGRLLPALGRRQHRSIRADALQRPPSHRRSRRERWRRRSRAGGSEDHRSWQWPDLSPRSCCGCRR